MIITSKCSFLASLVRRVITARTYLSANGEASITLRLLWWNEVSTFSLEFYNCHSRATHRPLPFSFTSRPEKIYIEHVFDIINPIGYFLIHITPGNEEISLGTKKIRRIRYERMFHIVFVWSVNSPCCSARCYRKTNTRLARSGLSEYFSR